MRIRFNGMFMNKSSANGGCRCHGTRVGAQMFITHKSFVLPSGATQSFSVGQEYDVSDLDGNFLLSYSQIDKNGVRQDSFTRLD